MTGMPPVKPEREFKVGSVHVAIWKNQRTNASGETFDTHRIQIERIYRDGRGDFQTTTSLETNDIPKAILALRKAYEYLTMPEFRSADTLPEDARWVMKAAPRVP